VAWLPPVRFTKARLPTARELIRLGILTSLVLAAMASTQLLPGASAQDTDATPAPEDDPADRSVVVTTDQAMGPDRSLSVPAVPGGADDAGRTRTDQVSNRSGRPALPSQLTPAGQDGGQLATQRLEGTDACDDALAGSGPAGSGPDVCKRPLETRSGEFAGRAQPQLSAEQRLLAQQFSGTATGDATDGTARRLGSGRTADLSNDDLAIASVVTSGQAGAVAATEDQGSDIPADATNAIDVILGVISAQPPK
jgi:hypothetical protein